MLTDGNFQSHKNYRDIVSSRKLEPVAMVFLCYHGYLCFMFYLWRRPNQLRHLWLSVSLIACRTFRLSDLEHHRLVSESFTRWLVGCEGARARDSGRARQSLLINCLFSTLTRRVVTIHPFLVSMHPYLESCYYPPTFGSMHPHLESCCYPPIPCQYAPLP